MIVVDLKSGQLLVETPLWDGTLPPVLAVDPLGKYLAVSGNDEHQIWVYRTDDILSRRTEKRSCRALRKR